jgi:hypothetical protein
MRTLSLILVIYLAAAMSADAANAANGLSNRRDIPELKDQRQNQQNTQPRRQRISRQGLGKRNAGGPAIEQVFSRIDKNGSGTIESEEAPHRMRQHWDRLDSNADGKIEKAELAAAMKARTRLESDRRREKVLPGGNDSQQSRIMQLLK